MNRDSSPFSRMRIPYGHMTLVGKEAAGVLHGSSKSDFARIKLTEAKQSSND